MKTQTATTPLAEEPVSPSHSPEENTEQNFAQIREDLAKVVQEGKALLASAAREKVNSGSEKATTVYRNSVESLEEGYEALCAEASKISDSTSARIRERPLAAAGISIGAGFLLGSIVTLLSRRS